MGPPKARPRRLTYKEQLDKYDTFEQRIDVNSGFEFLVNPFTGECAYGTDAAFIDRAVSMWMPTDGSHRVGIVTVQMYPCYYQSRRWGRRNFEPYGDDIERAARHIQAVTRGWLERVALRAYYRERFEKRKCEFSGYYYFYDKWNMDKNVDTTWYKPRLAFPDDIKEFVPTDKEDYMKGDKFTNIGFEKGPYMRRVGIRKTGLSRAEGLTAFLKPDPVREEAISHVDDIDLDRTPLGTLIAWMDGSKSGFTRIDDYTVIRTAASQHKWSEVHRFRKKHSDRPLVHCYALFAFSKMDLELEKDGGMSLDCADAMLHAKELIDDPKSLIPMTIKVFALLVYERFLSTLQGRAEFFDVRSVKETGKKRQRAIETYIQSQLRILTRCIDGIEMESQTFKSKVGAEDDWEETVWFPTHRGADMAGLGLSCLSLLAQEQEHRELMAETVTASVMTCMQKCKEEGLVQCHGLRCLYNMVYRCNAAQVCMLLAPYKALLEMLHGQWSGDSELHHLIDRFERCLRVDGWRGGVEKEMEKEFKENLARRELEDRRRKGLDTSETHLLEAKDEAKGAHGVLEHHSQGEAKPGSFHEADGKAHGRHAHEHKTEHKKEPHAPSGLSHKTHS